jgi:hypothetical protein
MHAQKSSAQVPPLKMVAQSRGASKTSVQDVCDAWKLYIATGGGKPLEAFPIDEDEVSRMAAVICLRSWFFCVYNHLHPHVSQLDMTNGNHVDVSYKQFSKLSLAELGGVLIGDAIKKVRTSSTAWRRLSSMTRAMHGPPCDSGEGKRR